jgi:uncharacterized protein GlcG (DUF336 family)
MRNLYTAPGFIVCCLLAAGGAAAQAASESPFHDRPASPRSLPADNVPPFGIIDDSGNLIPRPALPPGGGHRGANSEPESTAPGPTLTQAVQAARVAVDTCAAAGFRVGVAVVDSVGEARAMLTADGSDGSHVFVATRKALTALRFEMPSSQANELIPKDPELLARVTPNMFVVGGAVPIMRKGEAIGAIGVSGAGRTGEDEICAIAGLRKIEKQIQ